MTSFQVGIWSQIMDCLINTTHISSVLPGTFMDHLKWKSSPRPEGNTEEVLLALASRNVYLHLPEQRLPFRRCQGLLKLLKCIFGITFQSASVQRSLLCMETTQEQWNKKTYSTHVGRSCPCEMNALKRCKKIIWIWLSFLLSLLSYDRFHIFQFRNWE